MELFDAADAVLGRLVWRWSMSGAVFLVWSFLSFFLFFSYVSIGSDTVSESLEEKNQKVPWKNDEEQLALDTKQKVWSEVQNSTVQVKFTAIQHTDFQTKTAQYFH